MSHDTSPPDLALTADARVLAGRYRLLEKVGQGGMGTVFRAHDTQLGRTVAIKLLPTGKLTDAEAVARFQREARALARLSHPGIIQAYDSGQDGDDHFLVMEFVEGHSLARARANARPSWTD
jgi:serine/threonine-protein kinase